MNGSLPVKVAGESLVLLPPGAVWWERHRTLFAADIHLDAVPEPIGTHARFDEDLESLMTLVTARNAERIVVLGDFFHGSDTIAQAQLEHARAWRAALGIPVWLALGDHETDLVRDPSKAPFDRVAGAFAEEPFVFVHKPISEDELVVAASPSSPGYRLCGHRHPVTRLEEKRGKMQLRCFVREPHQLILPSYGRMTGGTPIEGAKRRKRYPVTGDDVLDLGI